MWPFKKSKNRNKTFTEFLHRSGPIEVQHETPDFLTPDGKKRWGADTDDFSCFNDFWYFADWINELYTELNEPIRLQELRDTQCSGEASRDEPIFGRRYDIFYNQAKIGILEITTALVDYSEDRSVSVDIRLDHCSPRMIPFNRMFGFLQTIVGLVCSRKKEAVHHTKISEYALAIESIHHAMLEVLWDTEPDYPPDLEIVFTGRPDHYYFLLERQNKK